MNENKSSMTMGSSLIDMFYKAARIYSNLIHSLENNDQKFTTWNQKIVVEQWEKLRQEIHQIKIDETFTKEEIKILEGLESLFETTNISD